MKQLILITAAFFSFTMAFAQTVINGLVVNNKNQPIPYVNIALLNIDSSTVKNATANESGKYTIDKVNAGSYIISYTVIGYKSYFSPVISISNNQINALPPTVLQQEDKSLQDIQILSKKPLVEQQIDRTVMNVAGSIIASGNTVLDVLMKAPGVSIDLQREQLELRGKEGVLVQIDGKTSYLSPADMIALLRSTPADNVDKIELITNPSAKYDASGNAGIINIKFKKNQSYGTNGTVILAIGSGTHYRTRGSGNVNYRNKKINIFANYGTAIGKNYWDLKGYNYQPNINTGNTYNDFNTHLIINEDSYTAKLGADYNLSKQTIIGAIWNGSWLMRKELGDANFISRNTLNGPIAINTVTTKSLKNKPHNQQFNINLLHNFKNSSTISVDVDAGFFSKDFNNSLYTNAITIANPQDSVTPLLQNKSYTTIDIYAAKTDFSTSINKKWKLEAGLKYASVTTNNNANVMQIKQGTLVLDSSLSNAFTYSEKVGATYINLIGTFKNTIIQTGVRAEYTKSIGTLSIPYNKNVRKYLNIFPSIFLTQNLGEEKAILVSYSYRIDRPNYEYMNPARSFIDLFTYSVGNINLLPQYTHAMELRYTWKKGYSIATGANFTKDFVTRISLVTEGKKVFRNTMNMGNAYTYTSTLNIPITLTKKWQMQATLIGFYNKYVFTFNNEDKKIKNLNARLNLTNAFTFKKGWTAELSGWVTTTRYNTIQRIPANQNVDIGLQKVWKNKPYRLKLSAQNIFRGFVGKNIIETNTSYQKGRLYQDNRIVMLTFSYNFGNQKVKTSRNRKTGAEEENNRVGRE